jgi:hypothetical protein
MKTTILLRALIMAGVTAFNLNCAADDALDDDTHHECQIEGNETMDAIVVLTATTNAPATAIGVAKIESENDEGTMAAAMELRTYGLDTGDYILSINRQSDGTNIVLGQITVASEICDGAEIRGIDHWIESNWGGCTNWGSWTNWNPAQWCTGTNETESANEVQLPSDLNPTDIAQIVLSDTNGNPVLIGDLITPAPASVININASVRLVPDTAASATGTARVQSTALKGKWKHNFNLAASNMGTNSLFSVRLNGKKTGATKSNKKGQMTIKKVPSRVPALRSLRLFDTHGNQAAHARF